MSTVEDESDICFPASGSLGYEAISCCPATGPLGYETAAPKPPTDTHNYVAFIDFECTGYEPFALGIQVVGFPNDASIEEFDRNIVIGDRQLTVADLSRIEEGVPPFEPSTKAWWLEDDQAPVREYFNRFLDTGGGYTRRPFHEHVPAIVRFISEQRAKYPLLRFATDNPTLDARYLDNIMDSAKCPRISCGLKWQRVLAVDDLRQGFELATGESIPKRSACPLRTEAAGIPPHAPDGDVLHIAADYADLLVAAAKRRKIDGNGADKK